MLLVKTEIKNSTIHGIGLFALENIAKGKTIWILETQFDKVFSLKAFKELPNITKEYIMHYSYFHKAKNSHVLCSDNARFFNKSENPNCGGLDENKTIALRDIEAGEELTEIYFNLNELTP
jgi:SET domain-containing protein